MLSDAFIVLYVQLLLVIHTLKICTFFATYKSVMHCEHQCSMMLLDCCSTHTLLLEFKEVCENTWKKNKQKIPVLYGSPVYTYSVMIYNLHMVWCTFVLAYIQLHWQNLTCDCIHPSFQRGRPEVGSNIPEWQQHCLSMNSYLHEWHKSNALDWIAEWF